ncbi:MAG: signal recognition particle receptor subunit alpha [Candidatus ainarchaeum sp.]|nr:signal recognition particle receptor subunit alpha [Candidatus ainarchaeum sp.]
MDLGKKLREELAKIANLPVVDESVVKRLIKELQRILISSDVNVKLVFELSKKIENRALHAEKMDALTLRDHVLKVVYEELVTFMGEGSSPRMDRHKILLLGLYGSGKTTSAAKLAYFYKSRGLSVALVGADVERPAAQEQLRQLAEKIGVRYYTTMGEKDASKVVERALGEAKEDIMIVDSAGRSAFDAQLATELRAISETLKPDETYLVMNADIGQVAGRQAEQFSTIAPLTGVIVTKMDGSGKGGGALSAVAATKAKIAFIGVGEKTDDFEVYEARRFVGRLLGMPDIKGLVEKIENVQKEEALEEMEGEELTIENFYKQLKAAKKMGPLGNVLGMMGMGDLPKEALQTGEVKMKKYEAIINSMTKAERKDASLIRKSNSRVERIAKGAGCTPQDVKGFLNEFEKMEKMMNMFKKNRGFRKQMEKMMKGGGMKGLGM